jgi:signal transduction histidine kinase
VVSLSCDLVARRERHDYRMVRELSDLPPIAADALALVQIVVILLENAAQAIAAASEPGGAARPGIIEVTTYCDADTITIRVRDTGCGIAAEHLHSLFEARFVAGAGRRRMGLGLAIARELASEHGGRIEVASQLGQGSEFRLIMPRDTGLALGQIAGQAPGQAPG